MLLRFLLYFFIGLFIYRTIVNIFRPKRTFKDSRNYYSREQDNRREGEVTIKKKQADKQKYVSKDEGDYIDYEEVK